MNMTAVGIYIALVLIPALPLLLTWRQVLTRRDSFTSSSSVTVKLPLLAITLSCLLFYLNLFFESVTGVVYSDRRSLMIVTAFGVSLAMVVLSLAGRNRFRWMLATTAACVSVGWLYIWAIAATV